MDVEVKQAKIYTGHNADLLDDKQKKDALTMIKILLDQVGLPLTDGNVADALVWVRSKNLDELRARQSESDMRATKKEFRKFMNRKRRESELKFMDHVGTIHVSHPQPDGDTVFASVKQHIESVAEKERTTPSEKSATAHADIQELARRFATMGVQFERPQGTSIHHFIDDLLQHNEVKDDPATVDFFKNEFQSFVIEHNWAAAFEGVKDFDGGEIKLPFQYTCFEFRINGVRVLAFLGEGDGIEGIIASGINKRWYINPNKVVFDGTKLYHPAAEGHSEAVLEYLKRIGEQIRAVCIMLDAKVAMAERRSLGGEALQKKRAREGRAPLRDYHVVSLAKRHRNEHERGDPTGIRKRLHWRRGHWRHFGTPGGEVRYFNEDGITVSKTWINWQLVGDETLGFIDKHYKL